MTDEWQPLISKHAIKRIRQRLGLPKKAAEKEMERALNGLKRWECGGRLGKYIDYLRYTHGERSHYTVTANAIYAFQAGHLVTVFPLPDAHKKSAKIQWAKLRS